MANWSGQVIVGTSGWLVWWGYQQQRVSSGSLRQLAHDEWLLMMEHGGMKLINDEEWPTPMVINWGGEVIDSGGHMVATDSQ